MIANFKSASLMAAMAAAGSSTYTGVSAPLVYPSNSTTAATTSQKWTCDSDDKGYYNFTGVLNMTRAYNFDQYYDSGIAFTCPINVKKTRTVGTDTEEYTETTCIFARGQQISGNNGSIILSIQTGEDVDFDPDTYDKQYSPDGMN